MVQTVALFKELFFTFSMIFSKKKFLFKLINYNKWSAKSSGLTYFLCKTKSIFAKFSYAKTSKTSLEFIPVQINLKSSSQFDILSLNLYLGNRNLSTAYHNFRLLCEKKTLKIINIKNASHTFLPPRIEGRKNTVIYSTLCKHTRWWEVVLRKKTFLPCMAALKTSASIYQSLACKCAPFVM